MLAILALAASCGEQEPVLCPVPLDQRFAAQASLEVTVVDSATGQGPVAGARGRWIAGTETDSLRSGGSTLLGFGPAGRYSVAVEAPGYRPWARSDVRVRRGECGVEMATVTARLQRQ
jgi:hypothetical protein